MNEKSDDGEISLVDILSMLLRHYKLICAITIGAIIITAAGYFVFPSCQYKNQKIDGPEVRMTIAPTPGAFYLLAGQPPQIFFAHPGIIQAVLEDVRQRSLSPGELLPWVLAQDHAKVEFTSENEKYFIKENARSGVFEIRYKCDDSESGLMFLQSLYRYGNEALEKYLRPLAKIYVEDYERIMNGPDFVFSGRRNDPGSEYYIMVNALLSGKTPAVVRLFEPYVLERGMEISLTEFRSKYKAVALLVIFGALFFSILLAFLLNAVEHIKNDQEAMRKIRGALAKNDRK